MFTSELFQFRTRQGDYASSKMNEVLLKYKTKQHDLEMELISISPVNTLYTGQIADTSVKIKQQNCWT